MGIYRTYFDKNNTIISGSSVNTGNNPVAELAYGKRITRFLANVDLSHLKQMVAEKELNLAGARHILKMKSTVEFSLNPYLGEFKQILLDETSRPTSFDMEVHAIDETWDEGMGYDFFLSSVRRAEDLDFVQGPSNWFNRTGLNTWGTPGAVASGSTALATQHFDKGNEDLEMDITDHINELILSTGATEANLCVKYHPAFEEYLTQLEYVTGFFTRHTQSYFEPYIETIFDDVVKDDRQKFFLNKTNRLYLYVNVGGRLTNLDELPVCTINGTTYPVSQQSKGVYFVEIDTTATGFISYKKYFDTWSGLKVSGKALADVKLDFIPKDESEYYQLTTEMVLPERYGVSLSGIKQEEKITSGEKRRIQVHVRKPYTVNQNDIIDDISYRVYVKVGAAQLTVVDWSDASRSNLYNYFTLDTTWMVPNKYYVDIMVKQNGETLLYNDQLVFNIVSKKKA